MPEWLIIGQLSLKLSKFSSRSNGVSTETDPRPNIYPIQISFDGSQSDTIQGGNGIDELDRADFSQADFPISLDDDGTLPDIAVANGTTVSDIEFINDAATGSAADEITFTSRRNNYLSSGSRMIPSMPGWASTSWTVATVTIS